MSTHIKTPVPGDETVTVVFHEVVERTVHVPVQALLDIRRSNPTLDDDEPYDVDAVFAAADGIPDVEYAVLERTVTVTEAP